MATHDQEVRERELEARRVAEANRAAAVKAQAVAESQDIRSEEIAARGYLREFDESVSDRASRLSLSDSQKLSDIHQAISDNIPPAYPYTFGGGRLIDILHGICYHAKNHYTVK